MSQEPDRPTPRTVVWDLGRVVVQWDPYLAVAGQRTRGQWEEFAADVDFDAFNRRQDAGRTRAEAVAALERDHPQHTATFELYMDNFARSLPGPVPGTAELIRQLGRAGIRQLGLTNWSAETFHHAEVAAPVIGELEDVLVSGREGVAKPDAAIFTLLLDRFGLDPAATVFIDDTPANVAAARAVGLVGLRFTGAGRLRAELQALGLLRDH